MTAAEKLEFTILPAGLRDLNGVRQLEHECFELDAWPLLDLMGVLTFPGIVRLKAVAGERMIGFAAGDRSRDDHIGWITTIGVAIAYRRKGVGKALLAGMEKALEMKTVRLCLRKSNTAALGLYHEAGYQRVDVWREYYAGGEDALVMEKIIQEW